MHASRMAGRSGLTVGKSARRATALVTAMLVGGGVVTALAGPASAATPGPLPGATPSAAQAGSTEYLAYTGTDHHVYLRNVTNRSQPAVALGGRLIGGPGLAFTPPGLLGTNSLLAVFGRGTDNALWWRHQTGSGWSAWQSLGGVITSRPTATGAVAASGTGAGPFGPFGVFARGTDGKVWYRTLGTSGWSKWATSGGRLLPGTGPGADGAGILELAVAGIDHHVWLFSLTGGLTQYGFVDFGGRTTADPAPISVTPASLEVFARGTDNALWSRGGHLPLAPDGSWHSLGGKLTSGVTATYGGRGQKGYVFVLGTDNQIWMRSGLDLSLGPWTRL